MRWPSMMHCARTSWRRRARCSRGSRHRSPPNSSPAEPKAVDVPDLKAPDYYINRELSFLEFNERVLALGFDDAVPLLERLKFLCISCGNLDEFFEIRVAGLKHLLELGSAQLAPDPLSIPDQLMAIHDRA